VLRLGKGLARKVERTGGHTHLLGGGTKVEERRPPFVFDAPAQVVGFRLALVERRLRLLDIALDASAFEDGNADHPSSSECTVVVTEGTPDDSVIAIEGDARQALAGGCM